MTEARQVDPELRSQIVRFLEERQERELLLLGMMRDMLELMRLLRRDYHPLPTDQPLQRLN